MRGRHTIVACFAGAVALAGCGSSAHHTTTASRSGALPARAHVVFASDRPAPVTHVSAHDAGTLAASLHFDPATDGFSFQNYGFIAGSDLDPHAMRELFGDVVCAGAPSDSCTLTPAAQQFASSISQSMFGGHCFGFATTSLRFFRHLLNPQDFGASSTFGLALSPELQSEIAASWATQVLPDVGRAATQGTPSRIVALLEREMNHSNGDPYVLGFYNGKQPPDAAGHAVTPIGVENLGGGRYQIQIYDNNKPGTVQAIDVDANAETWSYQLSTNPTQTESLWSGRGTFNEMDVIPLSALARVHPCPFCGRAGTVSRTGFDTITLGGDPVSHGHLLITADDGHRLGFVGGRFVNQIPGARVVRPAQSEIWKAQPEPVYLVPANLHVTVGLTGGPAQSPLPASVHVVGPGFGASMGNLAPGGGSSDELAVAPGAATVSVRVLGHATSSTPTLLLGLNRGRGGNVVSVKPTALQGGSKVTVATSGPRHLTVSGQGAHTAATITVQSVSPAGTRTVTNKPAGLGPGQSMTVGLVRVG